MVSEYAIETIEDLQEAGYKLSLRQIIEINALGCSVQFGNPEVFAAPRVAKAGSVVLHELSVQAYKWYQRYAGQWWEKESLVIALAWANCYSRVLGYFKPFTQKNRAQIRIIAWYESLTCTEDEFNAAFNYVNRTESFRPDSQESSGDDDPADVAIDIPDPLTSLVNDCLAAGMRKDEVMTRTRRELNDILERNARQMLVAGNKQDAVKRHLKSLAENKFLKYVDAIKAKQANRNAQIYTGVQSHG